MDPMRKQFPHIEECAWSLLETWAALLREWNAKINLISRKDIEFLEARHLSHCLSMTNHLKLMSGTRIMDVGTGGGFPGIPLAIYYPNHHFTLLDARKKKCECIKNFVEKLGLENVSVVWGRAEEPEKWELLKNSKFRVQNSE